jgi:hypothetical protein
MNFVNVHVTDNPTRCKVTKLLSASTVINGSNFTTMAKNLPFMHILTWLWLGYEEI